MRIFRIGLIIVAFIPITIFGWIAISSFWDLVLNYKELYLFIPVFGFCCLFFAVGAFLVKPRIPICIISTIALAMLIVLTMGLLLFKFFDSAESAFAYAQGKLLFLSILAMIPGVLIRWQDLILYEKQRDKLGVSDQGDSTGNSD